MKERLFNIGCFCVFIFLLIFASSETIGSDFVQNGSVRQIQSDNKEMTLEDFVQKLEEAKPWTREKAEVLFGTKFTTLISPMDIYIRHTASGPFIFGKELIIYGVSLRVSTKTKKTLFLSAKLDGKSSCFSFDRIEKSYPEAYYDDIDSSGGEVYSYTKKHSWGGVVFVFSDDFINSSRNSTCVSSIELFIKE